MCVCVLALLVATSLAKKWDGDFHVPQYRECEAEYAAFNVKFAYDESHYGRRDTAADRKSLFCTNLKEIVLHNEAAAAGKHRWTMAV